MSARAADLDPALLLDAIQLEESRGVPFPDGAVRIETLSDGSHSISRGRYQILEETWKHFTRLDLSWAAEPGRAKGVALLILLDCMRWYPAGGPKRIAYCYTAGRHATPYRDKRKAAYAERAARTYNGASR